MTRSKFKEAPPAVYEEIRAKTIMRNNRIFQSLGITALASMVRKSNPVQQGSDGTSSSFEYNPKDDQDEIDDSVVEKDKVPRIKRSAVKKTSRNRNSSRKSSKMAPGRVMAPAPGGTKRGVASLDIDEDVSARVTRQKTKDMAALNNENDLLHKVVQSSLHIDEEGQHQIDAFLEPPEQQMREKGTTTVVRHTRKGKGLERITKGLGTKVTIEVAEGKKRPEKWLQAAKLASECGFVARDHMPVLPHFKEHKKDENLVTNFIGKVAANFEMDTDAEPIKFACKDILKTVMKNKRYQLKRDFFDNKAANQVSIKSPDPNVSDEDWQRLVEMWSSPRHRETCDKNKVNRAKVMYPQATGSRCYIAHVQAYKESRKGEQVSEVDLFKECHNSSKKGFSEPVKEAITQMETMMVQPLQEGEQPNPLLWLLEKFLRGPALQTRFLRMLALSQVVGTK